MSDAHGFFSQLLALQKTASATESGL